MSTAQDSHEFSELIQTAINDVAKDYGVGNEPSSPEVFESTDWNGRLARRTVEPAVNYHTHYLTSEENIDPHELVADKQSFLDDMIGTIESEEEMDIEILDTEEIDADPYIEVQPNDDGFLSAEELDADGVKNLMKHKGRTNIKDLVHTGLE